MRQKPYKAYLYLFPALAILSIFKFYPIYKSFAMGFYTKFDYLTDTVEKTGLDNFQYVLQDPEFSLAVKNTVLYAVIAVPLGIGIAIVFSLLLNSNIRCNRFFRSVYFLPFVTSSAAISIMWRWMLNKDYGVINAFLSAFGMGKVEWLTNPKMTLPILILLSIWKGLGYKIIVLLAALQNVDSQYIKASKIDGANVIKRNHYVVLPMIKPAVIFLFVTSLIGSLKLFDEVYIMYQQKPGPLQSGLTIVYYVFDKFYRHWEFTTASAAAVILFGIILILTLVQLAFHQGRKKRDEMGGGQ